MKLTSLLYLFTLTFVACSAPKARRPVSKTGGTVMNTSVEISKKIYKQEEDFFRKYMKNDSLHTYHKSDRGFWYTYKKKNNQDTYQLKKGDEIKYRYAIKDIYGNEIYSEDEIGTKNYFIDEQVILQGLQEGLKLMHKNEEIVFLFPSYKAYGYSGNDDRIHVNQPLIYNVKLLTINSKNKLK